VRLPLGLCLLSLTALAQAERPRPTPSPRVWDIPQILSVVDVPGRVEALGVPVAMRAVRSKEKIEPLARHLLCQFQQAGLYLPPPRHLSASVREAQLTGLDPDTFVVYTIFLQPNPDHTTTVLLTESFLEERRRPADEVQFAPVMPGAKQLFTSRLEGLELLHYAVAAPPDEVERFHRETLGKEGFREVSPGTFQRKSDLLRVSLQAIASGGETSVQVLHRLLPEGL
jgi:hypothetical protein